MRGAQTVVMLALVLFAGTIALPAEAELTVTIQISGTIDEILPVLQLLQQAGLGKAAAESMDGLKLEISSTATEATPAAPPAAPGEPAPAPETAPPPAPPAQPSLSAPTLTPATAKPGEQVLITVAVSNPDGRIDTLAAHASGAGAYAFDLYDNGTRGDATAGDGVWSYLYTVDPNAAEGPIDFDIIAFNADADPVKVTNPAGEETQLTVHATIAVQKPKP